MRKTSNAVGCVLVLGLGLFGMACAKKPVENEGGGEVSATPAASAAPKLGPSRPPTLGNTILLPPELAVIPGAGLSSIRFGATFATVERHIGAPCDIRTETRCAYVDRGLDFHFEDGVVSKMRAERRDRIVQGVPGKKRYWGLFNGGMAPSIMIGLFRHVLAEEFKEKPLRTEPLSGPDGQVEKEFYPGVAFEFDKLDNGATVLAAFEITKDPVAADKALHPPKKK